MKKMILGAGAFLLSSTASIGIVHASSASDPSTSMSTAYANSMTWAMSPALQSAVVQAGMTHADPATSDWMNTDMAGKDMAADKSVSALYGSFDDAAAIPAGKNTEVTAAHLSEKQAWLADRETSMENAALAADEPMGSVNGKNSALTAEHLSEKQAWLAQNGSTSSDLAMGAGKGMNGQGGPLEEAQAGASNDTMWPACRPGPGDDRCIQTYERGVSRAFAQWSAGRSRMGMGGPEEPAGAKDQGMTSDMAAPADKVNSGMGPTTEPTDVRVQGK